MRNSLQRGYVYVEGNWWKVRWYEYTIGADGKTQRTRSRPTIIGPATGASRLSKKAAQQKAWDDILVHVNAKVLTPRAMMTLHQFWVQRFEPEASMTMKPSGIAHYNYCMGVILPELGDIRLGDINVEVLQAFVRKMLTKRSYSIQTVTHFKNAVSGIIRHAKEIGFFSGENPASMVRLPPMSRKKKPALSYEQGRQALTLLEEPLRTAALMSMTTSLNNSEIMGLRWEYVNLTNTVRVVHNDELGDIAIGPRSFAVVENWYLGKRGTVKTTSRNRVQPIPRALLGPLERLFEATRFKAPSDPVFASRVGTPTDLHNADKRVLKEVGDKIGVPGLSWQCFRRTAATLTGLTAMPKADRIALMGHSNSAMTDYYSDSDIERRRTFVDEVADGLVPVGVAKDDITVEELNKLWNKP